MYTPAGNAGLKVLERKPKKAQMIATATIPWANVEAPMAAKRAGRLRKTRPNSTKGSARQPRTSTMTMMMGSSSTAVYLATAARPSSPALSHHAGHRPSCRWRQ